jgi:hypothetical protein
MLRERTLTRPISQRDRVTATETIDGVECLVVLEQDRYGCYREQSVQPLNGRKWQKEKHALRGADCFAAVAARTGLVF